MATWDATSPHVVKALKWLRSHPTATPEALVEWDRSHGRHLFEWNDRKAAQEFRLAQARQFFNRHYAMFKGMKMKAWYNLPADEEAGLPERSYVQASVISENPKLIETVIDGIRRRMRTLARELRAWEASPAVRAEILAELERIFEEPSEGAA